MTPSPQTSIAVICTANICRSATAAHLLTTSLADTGASAGIVITSAGTHALAGSKGCDLSMSMVGADWEGHQSVLLSEDIVRSAGLILCADRQHRSFVAQLLPAARPRTFTLRQAERVMRFLESEDVVGAAKAKAAGEPRPFAEGDHRLAVGPLPEDPRKRLQWLVAEMDAARGLAPQESPAPGAEFLGDPDDIVDPHVVGYERHAMIVDQIRAAVQTLHAGISRALSA